MSGPRTAQEVLNDCFLDVRARLIDIAACFDRIERAGGNDVAADPRWGQFRQALDILKSGGFDRAERIQMVFSDPYQPGWNH